MHDLIVVGGGLASCLTAWRLAQQSSGLRMLILESGNTLGGNHTWSYFPTDLTKVQSAWIEPLISLRWSSYDVRFPGFVRRLNTGYCSTDSERFHAVMTEVLDNRFRLGAEAAEVTPSSVRLRSGETLTAHCVIDGRGPQQTPHLQLGFQKFTGQVLQLKNDHGLNGPIIMDATVPQQGDYRFVYTLPLSERQVLVEDTRYSNHPARDPLADAGAIADYALQQGWRVDGVVREEHGALPITLGGDIDAFCAEGAGVPRIGLRAALFHATTGYSFAEAVRTADAIAAHGITDSTSLYRFLTKRTRDHWRAQGYWRLLNRMLFIAAQPDKRRDVMGRFYRLREPLIERFYAGRSTWFDKARILTGKPPVAIGPALRCLSERSARALTTEVSK